MPLVINGKDCPMVGQRVEWWSKQFKANLRGRVIKIVIKYGNELFFSVARERNTGILVDERSYERNPSTRKYEYVTRKVPLESKTVVLKNPDNMFIIDED